VKKNENQKENKNLSRSGKTLPQKIAKGGFWIFSLKIARKAFSLIRLIIIGRILAPSDFGLIGITLMTMSAIKIFSQTGYREALMQRKKEVKRYLNTA